MSDNRDRIVAVPTNVITGFLGAGKTTAILGLLAQKPATQRWAVLVNEFGEIGIDGGLLTGQVREDRGVHVREVPGGCMCCAAGLPMQIALNQLLRRARPHRLLIEPTGLGHPLEVLQALSADHYQDVLELQKTVTLVDARQLSDQRYVSHPTFRQQLEIADVVVANKADLYAPADHAALENYLKTNARPNLQTLTTRHGSLPISSLAGAPGQRFRAADAHDGDETAVLASAQPFPQDGVITAQNKGDGFESVGWRYSPQHIFNRERLLAFFSSLAAERMKGIFITEAGIFGYNLTRDDLREFPIDECMESRIEIIAEQLDSAWHSALANCLETRATPGQQSRLSRRGSGCAPVKAVLRMM